MKSSPTETAYDELQIAYNHFNEQLFGGGLPNCLITLQREKRTYGYFSAKRFVNKTGDTTDEIAMNPSYFAGCPIEEIMQTLCHEMAHLWQFHFGNPGRGRYHNKEWAKKMESIGLMPSSTGKEGGAKTGDCMADYIIPGGDFEKCCNDLLTSDFRISWADRFVAKERIETAISEGTIEDMTEELSEWGVDITNSEGEIVLPESKPTRTKYTCPNCKTNIWGKASINVLCGDCNVPYEPVKIKPIN